jgi:hypothetical protein
LTIPTLGAAGCGAAVIVAVMDATPIDVAMTAVLDAIGRARVAQRRMRLAESLGDDVGVQVAVQAILHNLRVVLDVIAALPSESLDGEPWARRAALRPVLEQPFSTLQPAAVHAIVDEDLGALEVAARRRRAAG